MKGMLHIYTGNGKGKTTAALGLALRMLGAGFKVYVAQFVKGLHYNELNTLQKLEGIEVKLYGRQCFIKGEPQEEDVQAARAGLEEVRSILQEGRYQLMILDEVTIALYYNLFSEEELLSAIEDRAPGVEVVITGRYASDTLIDKADLVTRMEEVKHYYHRGIPPRAGIEH